MAVESISVVGLGKLGACVAACFASKGIRTVGVDVVAEVVDLVNNGKPPVFEPGLAELMAQSKGRLTATVDLERAVMTTDLTLILVPTPSEQNGGFSLRYVLDAGREIGRALKRKDGYHVVALTSTVLPGSTQFGLLPVLEHESGKRCGDDFGLCYSPEFIALGTVIRDLLNPDFVLIGEADSRAGRALSDVYARICENKPPVARMNLVNAELAKISVNTFVTMKITFANLLASLCERLPGGDVDAVTAAVGLDSRIGPRYLKGALGYGGPCFPRDNRAFTFLSEQLGVEALLPAATDAQNRAIMERLFDRIRAMLPQRGAVAVLGLSYKPGTNVIEEAQGFLLAARLIEEGFRVVVHDAHALPSARCVLGDQAEYAETALGAMSEADVAVITNPDPAYRDIDVERLTKRPMVLDAWRLLASDRREAGSLYHPLGIGPDDPELAAHLASLWRNAAGVVA